MSKSYEDILMNFRGVERDPKTNRLDFGGDSGYDPDPGFLDRDRDGPHLDRDQDRDPGF